MHKAQFVLQAPAKHLAISGWQEKTAASDVWSRAYERFQTLVGFGNGMGKERHACGIGGYRAEVLDDPRRSGRDRILEFTASVVPVYSEQAAADQIAAALDAAARAMERS
jgi:hypothetical protein